MAEMLAQRDFGASSPFPGPSAQREVDTASYGAPSPRGMGEFPNRDSNMSPWGVTTPDARQLCAPSASSGGKRGVQRRPWHSGGGLLTPGRARARRHTPWEKGRQVLQVHI